MVELALLLPILVFGLIGAADLARAFALQLAIQNGARAGAEAYAINFTPTRALAIQRAIDEMSRTPGMDINNPSLNVDAWALQADGATPCLQPPTVATPCFVTDPVIAYVRTVVKTAAIGVPNVTVTVTYPDTYSGTGPPPVRCADRNCRVIVDAAAPFVPLPSQYLLGGAFQITLKGGSQLVI